ncbi:MAG: rubrerythrin family protein [Promethearchaeota archaeon]
MTPVEALREAIVGELSAAAKYGACAELALRRGRPATRNLFRATAAAEEVHAKNHGRALEGWVGEEGAREALERGRKEAAISLGSGASHEAAGRTKADPLVACLAAALQGERWETRKMYPGMLKAVERSGGTWESVSGARGRDADAAVVDATWLTFSFARDAEAGHASLFRRAVKRAKRGKDFEVARFFTCSVCGHVAAGEIPEVCPICGHSADFFEEVA